MKKRALSMLLAVALIVGLIPISAAAETATDVQAWNITLGDNIGANFYLNVPDGAQETSVKVTVADVTTEKALTPYANGLFQVSAELAAAQMTEAITLQLIADGVEYTPVSYSIRDYALQILKGDYAENVKTLVKHMLGYGAAAQTYFGVNTDALANAGYALDYTAQYPEQYPQMSVAGQISGLQPYGASLVVENKVAVRIYFTGSLEGVSFGDYEAVTKDDKYYVEIPGINPLDYDKTITLTATKGEETMTVSYSPLTYMVRMSQKGSDEVKALVNAMYGYYEAAVAYLNNSIFEVTGGSWDLSNQYNGSLTVLKQKDGTTVKTNADNYRGVSVKVKEYTPSLNEDGSLKQGNFSAQISFIFDNGKQYQVRIHNTDDGNYKLQNMGGDNNITGWKWQADLTTAQKEKLINGDGVEFGVKLVGPNAELWVDGTRMKVVELGAEYAGKTAQISVCLNGNTGVENMEVPFALVTPTAPVQLNVAELIGGTVTADSGYQVGDTIPVTVKADAGYSQKLYINGQPLLLGGNTNTYSFVATEEVYNITGSFEPDVFTTVSGNWSLSDQQHGDLIITSQKDGTTVQTNAGGYKEVSVTVKDYTPSKNEDGSLKQGNFSMQVAMIFDDGKYYEVRIHNTNADGNYKLQNVGGANNLGGSGWPWLADLTTAQKAKLLDGDGVEFAVRLVDSKAELWVDGTRMKVIELGEAYEGKLAKVKLCMNGNTGVQNLHIPYELKTAAAAVELNVAELTNGTVVPENDKYQVGDTVFMTVNADAGYSQKLSVNGEALLLDAGSNVYSFVATEEVYNITGSFESDIFTATSGDWDLSNQQHGSVTITNKKSDGTTVITNANYYKEVAVIVKDHTPSRNADGSLEKGNFSMQIAMIFEDGKQYEVRIHNTDDGKYKLQNVGGTDHITGWGWQADLTAAQMTKLIDGDGVEFAVKLVGTTAELWIDGTRMKVVSLDAMYEGKLAQVKLCMNGNKNGQNIVIPFELKVPEEAPTVQFNIPELTNGTVAPEYDDYKVGDTVTLAVTAADGYSQKLYINGEPMLLDVVNNTCSFVATEAVYNITGSFEPNLFTVTGGSWNLGNQHFGSLTIMNKTKDGSTIVTNASSYSEVAVTVKDYTPSLNEDGSVAQGDFAMQISFIFDDGKQYQVRLHNTDASNPNYKLQNMGGTNNLTGWKWQADLTDAQKDKLLNGDGVEFAVKLVGSNAELWVDGTRMAVVALGDAYNGKLAQIQLCMNGNKNGQNIEIPVSLQ